MGVARCSSFKNRLSKFDSNHDVDPTLDSGFAKTLFKTCSAGDNAEAPFDPTKITFDNAYYNSLRLGSGLLTSDQTLYVNPRTRAIVNAYAMNQAIFFMDFQQAMIKMGQLEVKEDDEGEIRLDCRRIN